MNPTDSELEILQILWQSEPISVRAINEQLNRKREVGYTTTLKMLQIMYEKGLVERDTSQRSHLYFSSVPEGETKAGLLNEFLKNTFKGSVSDMVLAALGNGKASSQELHEIKALINQMENK